MAKMKVLIDLDSMSAILRASLPYGAKPSWAELDEGNVVIYFEAPGDSDNFSEVFVHLDFSEWATKVVRSETIMAEGDVFNANTMYIEHSGDIDDCDLVLGVAGASISPEQWELMKKQISEAFPNVASLVVNAPGVGLKKLK